MRYTSRYFQETVQAATAAEFDLKMDRILEKAASSGKEPQIHYFPFGKFCASVTYYISQTIPEGPAEKAILSGNPHHCYECPYYIVPTDGRVKWTRCEEGDRSVKAITHACDIFYNLSDDLKAKGGSK